ncbi:MAG: hypothetical protein JWM53_4619 [bacterium]|nr:hypothetical protein [bacterium]
MIVLSTLLAVGARASADCVPIANADHLVAPGARVHVGEMHGTVEIPRSFGELVCLATKHGGAVRVGLELPATEDAALSAYLKSGGTAADRAALLRGGFWTDKAQDGRRSQAMAQLLERIRHLRQDGAGADVDVVTFDMQVEQRDRAMAERLLAAVNKTPKATWLVLSGNVHARKTTNRFFKDTLMAGELVKRGTPFVTLDAGYGGGTAWVCTMDGECGPRVWGNGPARPVGVAIAPSKDGAYDGRLEVGTIQYSPPAAVPLTERQKALAAAIPARLDAAAAYQAKKFERCATLYGDLARTLRSADDAYNAGCCHALAGGADKAFAALGMAIEYGLSDGDNLSKDTDLAALHGDARWQPLLARVVGKPSAK